MLITANIGNIRAQPVRGTGEHECRAQPVRDRGSQPIPQIGENRDGEHECRAQTVRDRGPQPIPQIGENRDGEHECRMVRTIATEPLPAIAPPDDRYSAFW